MILRLLFIALLGLFGTPAVAQETTPAGGAAEAEQSWYDYFSGYVDAAVNLVVGSDGSESAAQPGDPNASDTADLSRMLSNLSGDQLKSLAGAAYGMLGGGSEAADGSGATDPSAGGSLAGLHGAIAGLFGGGAEGNNLAHVFEAITSLSPQQQADILNGVTTQIPGLLDKVQTWWSSLSETDRQGYIKQLKDAFNYLVGQVSGTAAP